MNRWSLTICAMAALTLGSCSFFHGKGKPKEESTAKEPVQAEKKVVPTEEQQTAARQLLETAADENPAPLPETTADSALPEASPIPTSRPTLRLGQFAPPEEAASAGENAAPAPNSVELHGFRSPSLPSSLPMDINGKLAPAESH